ncbi:hypothetical protein PSHT_03095 [Puccinia striiformis]|uniref:Uncharacterized protein n=1 Tax=Puccinia striiformis TaxID=27350 RepID=A0A2S4WGF8_9BASI|nr:hypothetical protein PSHT_03095 [Puccinia striiformis]
MSTRLSGVPLLQQTDPEAIIRAANTERRRLEQAALDPIRVNTPAPSTTFHTPTESDSSSIKNLSSYLVPARQSDRSTGQNTNPNAADPPADTSGATKLNTTDSPVNPEKSVSATDHLDCFLQIQHAGALQMQDAFCTVLDLQKIDREAAAKDRRVAAEDHREAARWIAFSVQPSRRNKTRKLPVLSQTVLPS